MTSQIELKINSANLSDVSNPLSGDCASVAQALVDCFDGTFVCLYSTENNSKNELPAHVLVEIDGQLYDGTGKVTYEQAFEIHLVLNGGLTKSDFSKAYFISEEPPNYMIDENVASTVQSRIS